MRKILFLLILTGYAAFSDCTAKSEIAVKRLAAESKNAGFEKVYYTFLGIMPEVPYLYLYKFNMETPAKKLHYTILVDVKNGIMAASESGNYDDIKLIEKNMKDIVCTEY